ncbi:MAG: hypothetical protein RLN96_10585, partial [Pseudomonadales bacterium]
MNPNILNSAILPILSIVFIADAIRDRSSGKYLGYLNRNVFIYAILIVSLETYLMVDKFGFSLTTMLRVLFISALPFAGAFVFVKYTHKQLF